MHISVTGISHQTAPVSVRERFAFNPEELPAALEAMRDRFPGLAILSTCNRAEVYIADPRPAERDEVVRALAAAGGLPVPEGIDFYHHSGSEAARHLFRVAASLESLVVGESEILGQVRGAFSAATAAGTSNPVLARLFHSAIRVGRRARSETEIGERGVSVSGAAIGLSRQVLGDLRRKTVLVVGAGDAGKLAAQALAQSGAGRLLVTTRASERARLIAEELKGVALPFADLRAAVREADIVISSTSAPDFVLSKTQVAAAMRGREDRRLVVVDIAVPRDVEPAAADVPGVSLFDIDAVQTAVDVNREARIGEVAAVERIVEDELSRFQSWFRGLSAVPTIGALRSRAEAVRQQEVARTLRRLPSLTDEERRRLEAMSKALVKRILHAPVARLRDPAGQRHLDAARDLFGLNDQDYEAP